MTASISAFCDRRGHYWSTWSDPFEKDNADYQQRYCHLCRIVELQKVLIR